ncbi:MAG: GNAT family N-acetyltransferase [Pseudomonadales bacterium]
MRIHKLEAADYESVEAVAHLFDQYRQFYEEKPNFETCLEYIKERTARAESTIFFAQNPAHEIVGFTQLYNSFCSVELQPLVYLYDLFVLVSARRTGAARALMARAKEYAIECRACRLTLATQKTNKKAQSLYESLGYIREGEFYNYDLNL